MIHKNSNKVREISKPGCLILIGMETDFSHSMETTVLDKLTWTHGLFLYMLANKLKGYKVTFF